VRIIAFVGIVSFFAIAKYGHRDNVVRAIADLSEFSATFTTTLVTYSKRAATDERRAMCGNVRYSAGGGENSLQQNPRVLSFV
jgi:hypothetical protein